MPAGRRSTVVARHPSASVVDGVSLAGMFSARRQVSGDACVSAAFPGDSLDGLPEAVAALARVHPSAVVPVLVASLNPQHWRSSRSAVVGLGAQGRGALAAAPAIAAWLRLCVDHGSEAEQSFGINESLYRLAQLRKQLDEPDLVAPPEALDRVRCFFDELFQPYLLTLLVPPVRYWQRGVIGYLRALHGDLEAMAGALRSFTVALREQTWPAGANSDWDEYTHGEALALIGELGPRLDRIEVEREPVSQLRDAADVDGVSAEAAARLLTLAVEDVESSVRTAALHAIADTGAPRAEALDVALRAAAAEDPRERAAAARLLGMLVR